MGADFLRRKSPASGHNPLTIRVQLSSADKRCGAVDLAEITVPSAPKAQQKSSWRCRRPRRTRASLALFLVLSTMAAFACNRPSTVQKIQGFFIGASNSQMARVTTATRRLSAAARSEANPTASAFKGVAKVISLPMGRRRLQYRRSVMSNRARHGPQASPREQS